MQSRGPGPFWIRKLHNTVSEQATVKMWASAYSALNKKSANELGARPGYGAGRVYKNELDSVEVASIFAEDLFDRCGRQRR